MYTATQATQKIAKLSKRIRAIPGGTSASKTVSIILWLINLAQSDKIPTLTSIVSESFPHLRRGAMRDFLLILQEHKYFKDALWDKTNSVYTFETGSKIEFFSVDEASKVRGARRDRLFINEANNVRFEAFEELEVRTKDFVFLDWNPTLEFWYYTEIKNKRTDYEELTLTYKDNEALSPEIVASIEQRMSRKGWWKVYGLGQLGEVEGKIYKDWQIIDEIPHEAQLERYGLDFGYTNDPTAITAIYYYNGGYILDEIIYQKGLTNKQIADILLNQRSAMCVADSAEPKSIDEIRSFGVNIQPAIKGPGSISQGIQAVQAQQISVTKRSANIIHEYRNFLWETDQNGLILNVPEKTFDHCFAPETLIHTTKGRVRIDELVGKEGYLYSRDGKIERFYDVKPTRANADVVCIEFTDGDTLTVTPDHLLLMPNGEWIEAFLLCPLDMIQLGIDGKTIRESNGVSRLDFYQIFGRKILQGLFGWQANILTPSYLGASERGNTKNSSHTSPGWGQGKQRYFKSRIKGQNGSLERTHDTGKTSEAEFVGGQDKTTNKEVAWVRYGKGVAQVAWEESVGKHFSISEKLLSLPQRVFYAGYEKVLSFLRLELQNESQAKTVKRTTRGFRSQTYNLEVENTHCLIANGVLAHNSMDSIRYGMSSLLPVIRRKELIENMPRIYRENKPSNPAR